MTLLLIDLDDTLLSNAMDSFLPAYLNGLSGRMASVSEPQKMIRALLDGTKAMSVDVNPGQTLEEKFDAVFFPALGLHRPTVQPLIDSFYQDDFSELASLTEPIPAAPLMVAEALDRGYQVVVATNPLFPRTAILQRLSWAVLPPEQVPFALIPSYETFHFAKPNPSYFAELLAQMGWPEGPVVVVGDDPQMDITPARQLGLSVFWVTTPDITWSGPGPEPPRGALEDLLPWLDEQTDADLLPDFSQPPALQAILRSTPAALATMIHGRSTMALTYQTEPEEWSVVEILCHLRDVEREVNLARLDKVMQSSNPFIPGQDTDQWARERQYINQDCFDAQEAFLQARMQLLKILDSLSDVDWDRPVRHAIFGPTKLRELINIISGHDRLHVRQVLQTLNASPR